MASSSSGPAEVSTVLPREPGVLLEPVLAIEDLHTYFFTRQGIVRAVNGLSLTIGREEFVGLVGETGSGKSVTAASVMGLVRPPGRIVRGEIRFEGRELTRLRERELQRIRGKKISLIVQNAKASLNPLLPVGKQILNVYRVHMQLPRKEAERHILRVLQAVGFDDPERIMESYPGQLSGGMAQRIVIAIAIGTSPDLVIADEPTTGLDVTVQAQVLDVATRMIEDARAATLLITHDLRIVANYCRKVAVMYSGRVVEFATVDEFFTAPLHPYSRRLLRALRSSTVPAAASSDATPEVRSDLRECQYRARCDMATLLCASEAPALREVRPGHWVECHHAEQNLKSV